VAWSFQTRYREDNQCLPELLQAFSGVKIINEHEVMFTFSTRLETVNCRTLLANCLCPSIGGTQRIRKRNNGDITKRLLGISRLGEPALTAFFKGSVPAVPLNMNRR